MTEFADAFSRALEISGDACVNNVTCRLCVKYVCRFKYIVYGVDYIHITLLHYNAKSALYSSVFCL